jgi:hypothetical protein
MNTDLFGEPVSPDLSFAEGRCRGCGKRVIWGTDDNGNRVPLDPSAPVYKVSGLPANTTDKLQSTKIARAEKTLFMATHFVTCAHVARFSSSKERT